MLEQDIEELESLDPVQSEVRMTVENLTFWFTQMRKDGLRQGVGNCLGSRSLYGSECLRGPAALKKIAFIRERTNTAESCGDDGSVAEQRTKREGVDTESVHNVMPSAGK
ncbi:hypothetical protein TNCV_138871 [Trichonephila clavipes]|nr:hypothetical protein TNCV_138871 [Trichonephila clavipes]